jgi:predicted nucleic acid-binding protein
MKVLFDTNVVLDLLLNRIPHNQSSLTLFKAVEMGKIEGVLCATTLTTINYLVAKSQNRQTDHQAILSLMRLR